MKIGGKLECSMIEWAGHLSYCVFTHGCNLSCCYCHAHQLVVPENPVNEISEEEIFEDIKEHLEFIDAVVISGGEPTIHDDLPRFIQEIKNIDSELLVLIRTNGYSPAMISILSERGLLDKISIDLKTPLNHFALNSIMGIKKHSFDQFIRNLKSTIDIVRRFDIMHEYRTVLCPQLIWIEEIEKIGKEIQHGEQWVLQKYRPSDVLCFDMAGKMVYNNEEYEALKECALKFTNNVVLL